MKKFYIQRVILISFLIFNLVIYFRPYSIKNDQLLYSYKKLLPQGWAFFTKDPKLSSHLYLFIIHNLESCEDNNITTNFSFNKVVLEDELFDFTRDKRKRLYEIESILNNIDSTHWNYSKGSKNITKLVNCNSKIKEIKNLSQKLKIESSVKYILVDLIEPLPYEWASNYSKMKMPNKYIILKNIIEIE
jgi:hypothetical protein